MSVTAPPLLATSSMMSIKNYLFLQLQEFVESSRQCKLPVDPCLEDRQTYLDIDSDQNHLFLMNLFINIDLHWILENDHGT
jgi:hypothetical protein